MGDCDSSDFDVITVEESEATPIPVAQGLLIKEKPDGTASLRWEKSFGCY
jgi:hypothetical protein